MSDGPLRLRAGSTIVTPSTAGELAGYAARGGAHSTGAHDELEAALVVLESADGVRFAWLTLDSIGITEDLAHDLRATIRRAARDSDLDVVCCASHTHSAPLGWTGSIHPGHAGVRVEPMRSELLAHIAHLATTVVTSPAHDVVAEWSLVPVPGVGANRLDPAGPHDDRAGVLALRDATSGAVRAVVFDFAAHPTVLGPGNLRWSADWPGAARAVLRAAITARAVFGDEAGTAPTVLFLQGASGDVSTRFTRRGDGFAEAARLGAIVAAAVLGAIEARGAPLEASLRIERDELELGLRRLPSIESAEGALAEATTALVALGGAPLDPATRIAQARQDGARVQLALAAAGLPQRVRLELSAVAIGDVVWAHSPLELFASIGADIATASPARATRAVGYTDGYAGYLADAAAHATRSYEALSTFFPARAAEELTDALARVSARATRSNAREESR